jgi:hypothetical protein
MRPTSAKNSFSEICVGFEVWIDARRLRGRRTRPEMTVETELNGVDVLRVRPEGRFGLPIEPSSEYGYPSQGRSSVL